MNYSDIHIDLETGSLHQEAAIYSIGAVAVKDGNIVDRFHMRVRPDCYEHRFKLQDNILWWIENNEDEFNKIQDSNNTLSDVLYTFSQWVDKNRGDSTRFWQKRFMDYPWLEAAYYTCAIENPIRHTEVFELCTWFEAKGYEPMEGHNNKHNALADAEAQAIDWIRSNEC